MLQNFRRIYALSDWTVERRAKGWFYGRYFEKRSEFKGPYKSVASVTLMVARQLRREVERRDRPYRLD